MMTLPARPETKPRSRPNCAVFAPAKLNLTLAVRGKRPDGFHDLQSLVVALDWGDTVAVEPNPLGGLSLECDAPEPWRERIGPDSQNLVWKSVRSLSRATGRIPGATIRLTKNIPPGSGLGGASSDAAATLMALNRFGQVGLSADALAEIGARVGSDVPLFFHLPAAEITGRGEYVCPLRAPRSYWVLLILPDIHLSTPAVYEAWDRSGDSGKGTPALEPDELEARLTRDPGSLAQSLFNDLETPAFQTAPALADLFGRIVDSGLKDLRMTGSGSCLFHLADDRQQAQDWAREIERSTTVQTHVARTLTSDPLEQGDAHEHH